MYIEFFGLSGSGKTSQSLILKKLLKIKYHRKNIPLKIFSFLFIKSYLQAFFLSIKISFLSKKISPLLLLRNSNAFSVCFYQYNYTKKRGLCTGHGFIQTFSQINSLEKIILKNPKILNSLLIFTPSDSKFIYLKTNKETAQKRAQKRSKNFLNHEKYKLDVKFYKILISNPFIKKRTFTVDGEKGFSHVKKELLKYKNDIKNT